MKTSSHNSSPGDREQALCLEEILSRHTTGKLVFVIDKFSIKKNINRSLEGQRIKNLQIHN